MRWLRKSSPLVLVAALFLSAGSANAKTLPSPIPQSGAQPQQGNSTNDTQFQSATPTPFSTQEKNPQTAKEHRAEHDNVVVIAPVPVARDNWFFGFTVLFDLLIALFTGLLWYTSKLQWKATRAALHINRPFLIVAMPEMRVESGMVGSAARMIPKCVTIRVKNFGTGPADVIDVTANIESFTPPSAKDRDPTVKYPVSDRQRSFVPIVRADEPVEMITLYFDIGTVADMVAICEETKRLGVYGEIRYRGGPPEEIYITKFFWWYFYGVPKGQDFARALTLELNDRT